MRRIFGLLVLVVCVLTPALSFATPPTANRALARATRQLGHQRSLLGRSSPAFRNAFTTQRRANVIAGRANADLRRGRISAQTAQARNLRASELAGQAVGQLSAATTDVRAHGTPAQIARMNRFYNAQEHVDQLEGSANDQHQ